MIDIVPYNPVHLEKLKPRANHAGELPTRVQTDAVTFIKDGKPLAIFGWYYITPGSVQAWSLLSEDIEQIKKSFHKTVKQFITYIFETQEVQRMQFSVRCDFPTGWKWGRSLGFSCEGIMRKYNAGADYWLFARVK